MPCTDAANWAQAKLADDELKNPSLAFTPAGQPRLAYTFKDPNTYAPLLAYAECDSACTDPMQWC